MKNLTITIAVLITTTIACKKSDDNKRKCYWDAKVNNRPLYWHTKPSAETIKKIQDTCACTFIVNETCVSCDVQMTDPSGLDVPCR